MKNKSKYLTLVKVRIFLITVAVIVIVLKVILKRLIKMS